MSNQKWASTGNFLSGKSEGGGERERGAGWQAGQQAGLFKVMLGLGVIEGRDRNTEIQRYRDTEIKRYRDTEIQRYRDTEIQRYRDTEIQRYRDTEIERNRNKET